MNHRRSRASIAICAVLAIGVAALALLGPLLTSGSPTEQRSLPFEPATGPLPLGSDEIGRDVLVRVLHGGLPVLVLAMGSTLLASAISVLVGLATGLAERRASEFAVRVIDVVGVAPPLLLMLIIATGFPGSDLAVLVAVALVCVPFSVRVIRAAARQVSALGFVEIARARGDRWWSVLRHDVLPAVSATLVAELGIRFTAAIHLTATAGFLGLGRGAPAANWGRMVNENFPGVALNPWPVLVPALLLVVFAVSVNLLADEAAHRIGGRR
ncbi:ABC transporter permease [Saccharopolyspora sp. NPDC000995]